MAGPKPQLVALLMCDQAFQQAGTGTWCIIGCFDAVNAAEIPFTLPKFTVYVALSDFAGDAMVELVIRDEEGAVVKAVRGQIPRIPLGLFQHVFPFPDVVFEKPGVHTLEFFAGGELITLRSFRVQSTAIDPEKDEAEAQAMDETHSPQIIADAKEVWSKHPDARPVGLIATPGASQAPWFRTAFGSVFGGTPPQAHFVGIVDPDTAVRLLGGVGKPDDVKKAIDAADELEGGRHLPIALVVMGGFRFVYHPVEE